MIVSNDGTNWYELSQEEFDKLLDDPDVDCWVDLSTPGLPCHVTLQMFRSLRAEAKQPTVQADWDRPTSLYGIPISFESDALK